MVVDRWVTRFHLWLARWRDRESGVALVEFAICVPILTTLVFGVAEYGLVTSKSLALTTSTRAGVRIGSASGAAPTADYDVLQAVNNSRSFLTADAIQYVVVFRATSPDGTVSPDCKAGIPVPDECNVYPNDALSMSDTELAASGFSDAWPSSARQVGIDYLGVYVIAQQNWLTGLFSSEPTTISDSAVMRIEPLVTAPWTPPAGVAGTTSTIPPATTSTTKKPKPSTTTIPGATTTSTIKKPSTTTTAGPPKPTTTAGPTTTKAPTTTIPKTTTTAGAGGGFHASPMF